jgi:Tol biopolymer transport system component
MALDPTAWIVYGTCNTCSGSDEQVWLAHPDNSGEHQIGASLAGSSGHPDLSHDGKQVAWAWDVSDTAPLQIYVAAADGSNPHAVTTCTPPLCLGFDGPAWSPDDTRIAVQMDFGPPQNNLPIADGIGIVDLATKKITQVTRQSEGQQLRPRWSPDGRSLVFWTDRGLPDGTEQGAIFIVNTDGTNLHQLTPWDENAGDPDWSPDGQVILYSTHSLHIDWHSTVESELMTMHPDGTGRTALTSFGLGGPRAGLARWILDGHAIIYVRDTGQWRHIWVIGADGSSDSPVLTTREIYGNPGLRP